MIKGNPIHVHVGKVKQTPPDHTMKLNGSHTAMALVHVVEAVNIIRSALILA